MRDTIPMTRRLLPLLAVLAVTPTATAEAKPTTCKTTTIENALKDAGESTGAGIAQVRCGDVTSDGTKDAVFTVNSGGTAGPTQFGVLRGASETAGDLELVLLKDGYKVTVDRVSKRRFDVQQPIYKSNDANCCPSAYRITPFLWNGERFKAGKSDRNKKPRQRFFDQG